MDISYFSTKILCSRWCDELQRFHYIERVMQYSKMLLTRSITFTTAANKLTSLYIWFVQNVVMAFVVTRLPRKGDDLVASLIKEAREIQELSLVWMEGLKSYHLSYMKTNGTLQIQNKVTVKPITFQSTQFISFIFLIRYFHRSATYC